MPVREMVHVRGQMDRSTRETGFDNNMKQCRLAVEKADRLAFGQAWDHPFRSCSFRICMVRRSKTESARAGVAIVSNA